MLYGTWIDSTCHTIKNLDLIQEVHKELWECTEHLLETSWQHSINTSNLVGNMVCSMEHEWKAHVSHTIKNLNLAQEIHKELWECSEHLLETSWQPSINTSDLVGNIACSMEHEWMAHAMVNRTCGGTVHAWNGQHRAAVIGTEISLILSWHGKLSSSLFFWEIAFMWMIKGFIDGESTLVEVMAWCHQATSHYLNQCWTKSMILYASLGHNKLKHVMSDFIGKADQYLPSSWWCKYLSLSQHNGNH